MEGRKVNCGVPDYRSALPCPAPIDFPGSFCFPVTSQVWLPAGSRDETPDNSNPDGPMAKNNYKETLNLPRTDFPMKGRLTTMEPEMREHWEKSDLHGKIRAARKDAPKWILHDGPPYANGQVHIGTGQNKILKDFVVKYRTMKGFQSPFVPGWDCHGLPIEIGRAHV